MARDEKPPVVINIVMLSVYHPNSSDDANFLLPAYRLGVSPANTSPDTGPRI